MDKESILVQLERLKRHYEYSIKTYDKISLLDLSHSLRIWTEYKGRISKNDFPLIEKPIFKTGSPSKITKKAFQNCKGIWVCFPNEVYTSAHNGQMVSFPKPDTEMTWGSQSLRFEKEKLYVSLVSIRNGYKNNRFTNISQERADIINAKYDYWIASEAIRIYRLDEPRMIPISREILIKRVANAFEASHVEKDDYDQENKFDDYIKEIMNINCGGLPIPYYILLNIAQDIIKVFQKILGLQ